MWVRGSHFGLSGYGAVADLGTLLPTLAVAVLEQDDQVRLAACGRPLGIFTLGDRELLAEFSKRLGLPELHRLEVAAQDHGGMSVHQSNDHALQIFVAVVE